MFVKFINAFGNPVYVNAQTTLWVGTDKISGTAINLGDCTTVFVRESPEEVVNSLMRALHNWRLGSTPAYHSASIIDTEQLKTDIAADKQRVAEIYAGPAQHNHDG